MAEGRRGRKRLTSHGLRRILGPEANTLIGLLNNFMSNDSGCDEINHGFGLLTWFGVVISVRQSTFTAVVI